MSVPRPQPVRCMCSWTGMLSGRAPCPSCRRDATHRITAIRGSVLHALHRGEQPVIWPIVRDWLLWARLIKPVTGRLLPNLASETHRRGLRRLFAITEAGCVAIGMSGAKPQEASAR